MRSLTRFAPGLPAFLLPALFLALAPNALAHTKWYVDGVNGNDSNNCRTLATACKTIGHAISLASSGDAITVAPAIYTENLTIVINLSIIGSGAATTIIDGGGVGPVVTVLYSTATSVVLSKLTIRNGYTAPPWTGGGILSQATLTIDQGTIASNTATSEGGGIYNYGTLTVNRSTISGNSATGGDGYIGTGGGIFNQGTLTVNDSTISGNSSPSQQGEGGGIFSVGTGTINNSTLAGNNAEWGGAIAASFGTLTVNNSTITGNRAESPAGIWNTGASVILQNSIVANNPGGNCVGTVTSNGYNLSSDNSCGLNGPGDMNNTSPRLGSLGNYGGTTQTVREMLGSPTVDAGNPNGCTDSQGNPLTTDQRGAPRPGLHKTDKRCDMGAFERQTD
jgi:hypothetical protein